MTPNDVLVTVRNQFYETTAAFLTDDEIYGYIWQADQVIARKYGCVQTTAVATTASGTQGYTAPTGNLFINYVRWDGVKLKQMMDQRDQDANDFTSYGRTVRSGQPTHYWQWGDTINLYPIPDQEQELKYYYCQNAPEITQSSTVLACPEVFHQYYADYVLWRCYLKDQDDGRAQTHLQLWNTGLRDGYEDWRRHYGEDMFYVVRDEDNYPQTEFGLA